MKKWLTILIIAIVAIAAGIHYIHRNGNNDESVATVAVTQGDITEKAQAIGYVKPRHLITIKSQVAGIVGEIYHYEGDQVKEKEPLIKITPTPEPVDYATAYENVQEATVDEKKAKDNLDRYVTALKQGLITKNYTDYISAEKTYETSQWQTQLAQQKLALLLEGKTTVAGYNIGNVVNSPINGFILYRNVDIGDTVISSSSAQAATTLFTIANMSDLMFEGSVDEMDAAKIHLNMPTTITIGAMPQTKIQGTLTNISLQSDQQAGSTTDANSPFNVSFKIDITKLQFPKDATLRAGYSATADIVVQTVKNILLLPVRAIHFDGDKTYVLLPTKNNEEPQKQYVTLGISDGMNVEIKSGLKLNDKVLDNATPPTDDQNSTKPRRRHP